MISHDYRCIFIHIPKCAGTSIEDALGHLDNHPGRGGQDHRSIRLIEPIHLSHFRHIIFKKDNFSEFIQKIKYNKREQMNPKNKFTVNARQFNSYFKFTVVRNPWSRIYSWYSNVMRDEIHKRNYRISEEISLKEFLQLHIGKGMIRPQTYWIKSFNGSIPLDYIGRFENLHDDFAEICKRMGIKPILLPHRIQGTGGDYRESYDQESIKLVADVYKEEIELFGYTFSE